MKTHLLRPVAKLPSRYASSEGQTVIEYALIVAVLSIGLMTAVLLFGQDAVSRAASTVDALVP